jgi:Fur family ferric uptake transcriptional regulator
MKKKCCGTRLTHQEARDLLTRKGLNKTKLKIEILLELSRAQIPLSVPEIFKGIGSSCNVSTIFRAVTQFKEKNLIQEVNLDEGFIRYELIPTHDAHHHHVRCRTCGVIKNLDECDVSAFENAIAKLGFKEMAHRLEFTGLCSQCWTKKSKL